MKNQIIDLHWKSINYLINVENIGCIIIENWSILIIKIKII